MKIFLAVTELGLLLLDEKFHPVSGLIFPKEERGTSFIEASSGTLSESQLVWVRERLPENAELVVEAQLVPAMQRSNVSSQVAADDEMRNIRKSHLSMLIESGFVKSIEEAEESIREVSMEISSLRIKEMSSNPDLQATEAVQALDEVDKTANTISSRLREWYGLHFPELVSMVDDNISLSKLIINFKSRENFDANLLEQIGYSKAKSKAIEVAAKSSKGADLRDEDLLRIIQLAEEAQHLFSLRDKLASHVEKTMRQVAPNLTDVAGASIGARLIAKAGGLRKLAMLPASTIQILGAEKALYRALKSGARPPKHGILFQHASVHSAPKWQRGKVARSVAGKIAIAARVDTFRGSRDESILPSLQTRLDEIKEKYKEAPVERKEFVPRPPSFGPRRSGREKSIRRRDERRQRKGRYGS